MKFDFRKEKIQNGVNLNLDNNRKAGKKSMQVVQRIHKRDVITDKTIGEYHYQDRFAGENQAWCYKHETLPRKT